MRIASLQKQSLIDWPGKMVAVVFTKGCNFRCGYCHNPSLVLPALYNQTPNIDPSEVLRYLKDRASWLDGLVVTGGEPTIQKGLKHFLNEAKKLGYSIKLDTNGSNPNLLHELIESKLVDTVAMDIKTLLDASMYAVITNTSEPNLIASVKESLDILRHSKIHYQLRTTVLPNHHNQSVIAELEKMFGEENYCLQEFRDAGTLADICNCSREPDRC
jgi:pyruvate formate lyase activating enzyme